MLKNPCLFTIYITVSCDCCCFQESPQSFVKVADGSVEPCKCGPHGMTRQPQKQPVEGEGKLYARKIFVCLSVCLSFDLSM